MKNIYVTQSAMPTYEEYCEEIKNIWDTRILTNHGPKHQQLENDLKEYLKVENISLFVNGHAALVCALKSLNLTGEVITTPFTFISTTNAILECGLEPIFCDIDSKTYTIDTKQIEALITSRTSAILAVHVYGNICDVEEIERIAKKYNLKVIYDAAHVFNVFYKGKNICTYGDISMVSFHATKVFHTIEGGALIYKDRNLYDNLLALKNFGLTPSGDILEQGINAKMNEFQAAMGLCNIKYIEKNIQERKRVAELYNKLLYSTEGLLLNTQQEGVISNYAYYPVVCDPNIIQRDFLFAELEKEGIHARKYFYPATNDFTFSKLICDKETPISKAISENVLCLPLYPELHNDDVIRICDIIKNIINNRKERM